VFSSKLLSPLDTLTTELENLFGDDNSDFSQGGDDDNHDDYDEILGRAVYSRGATITGRVTVRVSPSHNRGTGLLLVARRGNWLLIVVGGGRA